MKWLAGHESDVALDKGGPSIHQRRGGRWLIGSLGGLLQKAAIVTKQVTWLWKLWCHVPLTKLQVQYRVRLSYTGDIFLLSHDHGMLVDVNHNDCIDGHRSVETIDATVACMDLYTIQCYILILNQIIYIKGLPSHLVCLRKCHLNGALTSD